ncbi:hypothetical protein [Morganella morganii]|uniref:hypothetical protein n=1 Tax=Morganella morganii TaxID=582 RepID=UPI0037833E3F
MKKIGDVTSTADKNGEWTNGNVAAGIAPTILEAGWLNSVQREILGVLIKAGIQQDKNNDTQLAEAISTIISGGNYATTEDLKKYLAKDQNGADIPNKDTFIKNLGLPELLNKKFDKAGGEVDGDVSALSYTVRGTGGAHDLSIYPASGSGAGMAFMQYHLGTEWLGRVGVPKIPLGETWEYLHTGSKVLGLSQKLVNVTNQRNKGVLYYNTTRQPMMIAISLLYSGPGTGVDAVLKIDDVSFLARGGGSVSEGAYKACSLSMIIPPGASYILTSPTEARIESWVELR